MAGFFLTVSTGWAQEEELPPMPGMENFSEAPFELEEPVEAEVPEVRHDPKIQRPLEVEDMIYPRSDELPQPAAPTGDPSQLQVPIAPPTPSLPEPTVTRTHVTDPERRGLHDAPGTAGAVGVGINPPHFPDPAVDPRLPKDAENPS